MKNYAELLKNVPATGSREVPQPKVLMKMGLEVIADIEMPSCKITVYENGFYVAKIGERYTAYAVDRCKGTPYIDHEGNRVLDPEWKYMNEPWYIPLWIMAERRMAANIDSLLAEHEVVCEDLNGINIVDEMKDNSTNPEWLMEKEYEEHSKELRTLKLRKALGLLTPIQTRCINEHFYNGKTYRQIALELSQEFGREYSFHAVEKNIKNALIKLKKNMLK